MRLSAGLATLYNDWSIQLVVIASLVAHVTLSLFASVRRRQGPGLPTAILWAAYQLANWATPFVLTKLTVRTLPQEQERVALWVPFLLTHLAGPDNITAYAPEDNKLSSRTMLGTIFTILYAVWASFAIYKKLFAGGGDRALLGASLAMGAVAVAKCSLKLSALRKGGFGKIRSASKDRQPESLRINIHQAHGGGRHWGRDEKALLVAHQLLHITKASFADFPVLKPRKLREDEDAKELFHGGRGRGGEKEGWENLCRVVEMEVSLMYDILYTKAAAIHTWWGYLVCAASPVATATAALLFWFYRRNHAAVPIHREREADVCITYSLFAVTFILDVRWLLRAAASTWAYAYAFLAAGSPGCWTFWLRHHVFCSGRWRRFRQAVVSLDRPRQLLLRGLCLGEPISRGSYRLWSGNLGSYNLLDDCTGQYKPKLLSKLVKMCPLDEDTWFEYEYSSWKSFQLGAASPQNSTRKLLFDQIRKTLGRPYSRDRIKAKTVRNNQPHVRSLPYNTYHYNPYEPYSCSQPQPHARSSSNYYSYNPSYCSDDSCSQPQPPPPPPPPPSQIASEGTNKERRNLDYALGFVPEFQEAILVLHVATDVFFLQSRSSNNQPPLADRGQVGYKKVIQVVSNYMAFLAAARPEMVPGVKLRSLYSLTRDSLVKIRDEMEKAENQHDGEMRKKNKKKNRRGSSSSTKDNLALFLQAMEDQDDDSKQGGYRYRSKLYRRSGTLSDGIVLANVLLARLQENWRTETNTKMKKTGHTSRNRIMFLLRLADTEEPFGMDAVLKQILQMWVRLLIFVSTRCGRDSHARQLARGCELTTILWILVEHAKIFRI